MRRLSPVLLAAVALLVTATPASAAPALPAAEGCGVRVNRPHFSTTSEEVHTRIESFCRTLPVVANTVWGKTYRMRFWGGR